MNEVFNGFISWDSKFWTTLIPLLIKPGKVSRDYIEGKRNRYSNPFQFYLTVSVIFFLLIGLTDSYEKFKTLNEGKSKTNTSLQAAIDSIGKQSNDEIVKTLKKLDSADLKKVTTAFPQFSTDTVKAHRTTKANKLSLGDGIWNIDKIYNYQKKNPDVEIDAGLDSLKIEKTFLNRFIYNRAEVANTIFENQEKRQSFLKQLISYASISLFVFLPLFTLSLKLFYVRRKYTYVEHLIFVFHTQTVFFLFLTAFYFINYFKNADYIMGIFFMIFLIYLFIAMRKFYQQGAIKTFIKFVMLNIVYMTFASIGILIVGAVSFMLY